MEPRFRVLVTMRSWRTSLASAGYANLLDAQPRVAEVVDVSDHYPLDWMQRNALASLGLLDAPVQMWLAEAAAPW